MVNISQINSNTLQLNNLNKSSLLDLKVGQSLTATIIKPVGNQLLLQIGAQTLLADTKLTHLKSGQLQVTVKQTQPGIVLTVNQASQAPPQNQNATINTTLQATYRQALAQQLPISQALNQILNLPNLPVAIQSTLQTLLEQLLRPKAALEGKDLKQFISQSGLFLEGNLKQNRPNIPFQQDTKAKLLQLQQQALIQLQNNPKSESLKQLNSLINQALNKLTVQQLQLYENPNMLNIEIPMQHTKWLESFRFEIYRQPPPAQKSWEVLIRLTIEEQQLDVKLQLNEESDTLFCNIWCESLALEKRVKQNLEKLQSQFTQLNINIADIKIVQQPFKVSEFATRVALIDISV